MKYIRWIWLNTAGIRLNTAFRIVAGIAQVLLGLLMIWLSKQFIDVTIRTGNRDDVFRMVLALVAVVVGGILLRQLYYYMSIKAATRQSNAIRLRAFSCLFHRQMFEDQLHSGDVTQRLSKDIDTVADVTTSLMPQFIVTGVQLSGAFLLLYSMDSRLALALLLVTPVVVLFGKLFARRLRNMTQDQLMGHVLRRTRFTLVTRLLLAFTFSLGYLMAFIWGGLQLRTGAITFGVMTSFLQLVGQIQNPIFNMLNMMPQFFYATASIDRLNELEKAEAEQATLTSPSFHGTAGIKVEDVTFGYADDERTVLQGFTHDFSPSSKTAVMGQTGIGKTTLFRLMLAFITPEKGTLTLYDGHEEHPASVDTRGNFVFVPQGNTLMSGTVRYNLQLARPEATDEELRQVLHVAMADFVNELPQGIDTMLGERGIGLSEGQAQRIAIARGLLRPGSILLLDEISSSLDEQTEQELFRRLFDYCKDKTMIFITHRPGVSLLCDNVIRLQ